MHDIKAIRDNPAAFDAGLKRRGLAPLSGSLLAIDERRRAAILASEQAQARRNAASKEIGDAKKARDEARAAKLMAEVADTTSILPELERRPEVRASLAAHRDTVRALIPELVAAQKAKDRVKWDRAADRAAKQWDAMQATYIASARLPEGRARIERFIHMLLGEHVH